MIPGSLGPMRGAPIPTPLVQRLLALPPDSLTHVQAAAWYQLRCCLFTGMRAGELAALPWKHVDFAASSILVVGPKDLRARLVPLHAELADHLQCWKEQCPLAAPGDAVFRAAGHGGTRTIFRRAGLNLAGLGLVRLSFIVEAVRQGVRLEALQRILGYYSPPQPEIRPFSLAELAAALAPFTWTVWN